MNCSQERIYYLSEILLIVTENEAVIWRMIFSPESPVKFIFSAATGGHVDRQ